MVTLRGTRVALFANTDWYLYNFRLPLAETLKNQGCEVVLVAPAGPYARHFAPRGLRFVAFPFDRLSLNPAKQASAVVRLAGLYRRERLDLVHHFTIKCAVYGSLAARMVGPTVVVNALTGLGTVFTEPTNHRFLRALLIGTLKMALARTDVIVQNPDDERLLLAHRLADPTRTHLIRGSGVNLAKFEPKQPNAARMPRVLLASRLIRAKGLAAFEDAARQVRERIAAEFLIAGGPDSGNPDTLTASEVAALAKRGHVVMLGHVEDMPALLASVDLVVLPTTYGEGVPRILVEAAAAGLPLVATNVPGCREIVVPGKNGLLIDSLDSSHLANAIGSLLADPVARHRMGVYSRTLASEFSETRVISDTLTTYAKALSRASQLD